MFKVNNKDTKMCEHILTYLIFEHVSHLFLRNSVVDFEQLNVRWEVIRTINYKPPVKLQIHIESFGFGFFILKYQKRNKMKQNNQFIRFDILRYFYFQKQAPGGVLFKRCA